MAKRYHVSQDGVSRICTAQTTESCTAIGVDGEKAPHGEFADAREAQRFAEHVLEGSIGSESLASNSKPVVTDRGAFSTDMTDSSEYRVEGGRLKAEFEGESYDLGQLREVSREKINSWSQEVLGEDVNFQDGEIYTLYDVDGNENGAYARFGDRFYRAGEGDNFYRP